ncbi:hypothetical protein E2C01_007835 [Portunus trituberculatus]|uniref:Uncharacterized protein n=1 Tax=Portunus trituberculatus TaxID=210409 RepID=A0A5B7CZ79_PORTR|nr:hypothetical protein [Portunus trituberculatus]
MSYLSLNLLAVNSAAEDGGDGLHGEKTKAEGEVPVGVVESRDQRPVEEADERYDVVGDHHQHERADDGFECTNDAPQLQHGLLQQTDVPRCDAFLDVGGAGHPELGALQDTFEFLSDMAEAQHEHLGGHDHP